MVEMTRAEELEGTNAEAEARKANIAIARNILT